MNISSKNTFSSPEKCDLDIHTVSIYGEVSVGTVVDIKHCEENTKETTSDTREAPERCLGRTSWMDNVLNTSLKTLLKLVRESSLSRMEEKTVSASEEKFEKPGTEKRPSRHCSQEINLALSKDKSTWSVLDDNKDNDEEIKKWCETLSSDVIPPDVNEENEANVVGAPKTECKDEKPKIDPFQIVHKMHRRLSLIIKTNEEHQPNEVAFKNVKDFDVSKYVDDNWDLNEENIGLFPDDDYALTYKDGPDALPSVFEGDERFVMIDGLIQLAPEPVKSTFIMPFRMQSCVCATEEKKTHFAGTA